MIRRGFTRKILVVAALILIHPNFLTFILGSVALVLGALLHLWAKGCLVRNEEVTMHGPYRFVRHPFYLGNAFIDLGICLIANRLYIYILYPILFIVAYTRTIRGEEKKLAERHGEVWRAYRNRVPAMVPYRWPIPPVPNRGFLWANLIREKEIPRFIRLLSYPLLFHLWSEMLTEGTHFWRVSWAEHLLEIGILIVMYATAAVLAHRLRPPTTPPPPQSP